MKIRSKINIRRARIADAGQIRSLQDAAFRMTGRRDYEPAELASFLTHVGTLEEDLLADGTYFVAEIDGEIVAGGGWSARPAAYSTFLSSGEVAAAGHAVIRGIYADPAYAAAGLAGHILEAIETDIERAGFDAAHLATTYTGMPFYTAAGYLPRSLVSLAFPDGQEIHGVAMGKPIYALLAAAA